MAEIKIPYGRGCLTANIPAHKLVGVLESKSHHYQPEAGERELVQLALENPICSPRLSELAKGKAKVVIIASDHTRPVPSKIIAPAMLAEIRAGNPQADITFLIATGFHRLTTREELIDKFGEEIVNNEKIVVHDAFNDAMMVNIGKLPSGGDIMINRLAVEADLLVAEGFIEPHFFAGFSGGRKSVLPGVVSKVTVLANHNARFIAHKNATTGVMEDNPVHIDMLYAAKKAKLAFIVNVIIDADKKVIKAYAGDVEAAHVAGTAFAGQLAEVSAQPADIVLTSNGGYPLDQNIYQAVKSMTAAEATCKPGGVIIVCAACNDGHGGDAFYRWFTEGNDAKGVMAKIMSIAPEETIADQWQAQILARVLMKHTVIIVSDQCQPQLIDNMQMKAARTLPEAMALAEEIAGPGACYTVVPDGVSVIVRTAD